MAGRPTKLTPDTVKKLADAIRIGSTYALACMYAGISNALFCEWRAKGLAELARRDNPRVKEGTPEWVEAQPFVEFVETIQEAEGKGAVLTLLQIEKAANDGDWRAGAWKLERRYPQDYGRQVTELQGKDGGPIAVKGYATFSPGDWDLPPPAPDDTAKD